MENTNKWSLYIGLVSEDRIYNSKYIKVYCNEILPFVDGSVEDMTIKDLVKIIDDVTQSEEMIEVNTSNTILAKYFDVFPNCSYPPFVRKGQRVLILRYMDDDQYYWLPLGLDKHLNEQEVFRIFCKDTDNSEHPNDNNSYFIEIDTLFKKRIRIQTSKSDQEQFRYSIIIDSKKNIITISDDQGRMIVIDSDNDAINIKNQAKSVISIQGEDGYIYCPNTINIKADKDITLTAGGSINLDAPIIDQNK